MNLGLFVIGAFVLSACIGWLTIPRIVLISKKKKLFDALSERKSHTGSIPRLGGVSFFPSFMFALSLTVGLRYFYGMDISPLFEMEAFKEFLFLLAGATILFFIGMADDLSGLSYRSKLLAQFIAAVILIYAGVGINDLGGLFGIHHVHPVIGSLLSILVILLLTNAYNLIDGIDGLCSGLSLLALFTFGIWFWVHDIYIYAMMAMAMAGVVAVFFFFNVMGHRLKIFMGDTGSLMLGYLIAFLGLKFYDLNIGAEYAQMQAAPAVFLGIVFIPAFDTLRVFFVRMSLGLSPFYPDRRHIHHKMLALGLTHLQSTLIIILIQTFFIFLNLSLKNININILFALDILLGVLLIFFLNRLAARRQQTLSKK